MRNINPSKALLIWILFLANSVAANGNTGSKQFIDLSLEELMNVRITSASRNEQKLAGVASAVFVITQDDIRRSGATNIPDALRMAPGIQVERVGTDKWAVSIRGFNGIYSNKLQVLMDGRSVYNPLFSGVLWEQQDTFIEDIERIEVIRGPAATVWGANAVNGVINIITKKASETQGTLLSAGGGGFEHGFVGARYGGKINEETPFRIYAKGFTRDNTVTLEGENRHDQWHSARGGFRLDHTRGIDQFTLQGDLFFNATGDLIEKNKLGLANFQTGLSRGHQEGGNIRFRWDRTFSERSAIMLQTYYDRVHTNSTLDARNFIESFDIDFQQRFPLSEKHDVTWGLNYRLYHNKLFSTASTRFSPPEQTNHLYSAFIRDDVSLIPDRLKLTLGTRFDHNDFTGLEIQPNARLMWTPDSDNSIWFSVSRAVRTPSRGENDAISPLGQLQNIPGLPTLPFPISPILNGSGQFNSEKLLAYELGTRHQLTSRASIDITGFINDYSQLRDLSFGALSFSTGIPRQLLLPILLNNHGSALTYGVETSVDWKPINQWRLQASYSFLNMHITSNELLKQLDPTTSGASKANPQHQLSFRSNYDISEKLQVNIWVRYTSDITFYNIPGYVTMDTKLAYKPIKNIEVFLVGQNLFREKHQQYVADAVPSAAAWISRGIYVGARWQF